MDHYRTYLRAELGKFKDPREAQYFLNSNCQFDLNMIGLKQDKQSLSTQFINQYLVDSFVESVSNDNLINLTHCCSKWRNNGVSRILKSNQVTEFISVPIENIKLSYSESCLNGIFRKLNFELKKIANDSTVLATKPYSEMENGTPIEFATCLAQIIDNQYKLIDGMHRSINLAINENTKICVCAFKK
jgi:hypothetical protein